jgi:predicted PolB exonuclease-like 3'-5' exonuclease
MRFSVFALSSVPDTATTRQLFGLDDLDDKSVSKVLFHRRKQQTGSSEILRWDQRAIAGLTLIQHSANNVGLSSMNLGTHSEEDMLHAFFKAVPQQGRMVSWDDEDGGIPLLHFRTLKHAISYPAYWQALTSGANMHMDIRGWLSPPSGDRPTLDEITRKLGFPGQVIRTQTSVMDAWLQGRHDEVQAYSDIKALNTYLLALRLFTVIGDMTAHEHEQAGNRLLDELTKRDDEHLTSFVTAWSKT